MSKPYQQPELFTDEEMYAAWALIQGDNDHLVAAESWIGGAAQDAYNRLASLDPGELEHAGRIWIAFHRLGSSKKSDGDAEIMTEHMTKLERRGYN